jgi:hypothetical protein
MNTHEKSELMKIYYSKNSIEPCVLKPLRRPSSRITAKIKNFMRVIFRILFFFIYPIVGLLKNYLEGCRLLIIGIVYYLTAFVMICLLIRTGLIHYLFLSLLGIKI